MQARRIALACLAVAFAVAPAVLAGAPAYAASATLTLSPSHGEPGDEITALYQFLPDSDRCNIGRSSVEFFWDSQPIERSRIRSSTCSVQVHLRPPRSRRTPGQHRIAAATRFSGTQAFATYTIDGGTPTASSSPLPEDSAQPQAAPPANLPIPSRSPDLAGGRPAWVWPGVTIGILLVLGGAGFLILMVLRMHGDDDEEGGAHREPMY